MIILVTILLVIVVVLQIFDFILTDMLLARGAKELNPVIRYAMTKFGEERGLLLVKMGGTGVIIILHSIASYYDMYNWMAIPDILLIAGYFLIVRHNLRLI